MNSLPQQPVFGPSADFPLAGPFGIQPEPQREIFSAGNAGKRQALELAVREKPEIAAGVLAWWLQSFNE